MELAEVNTIPSREQSTVDNIFGPFWNPTSIDDGKSPLLFDSNFDEIVCSTETATIASKTPDSQEVLSKTMVRQRSLSTGKQTADLLSDTMRQQL